MVGLSFYGIFRKRGIYYKNTCYNFFTIISFALLLSSCFNPHVYFRLICQTPNIEMLSLNRNEKVTCETCGTQTTKPNLARHKKRCSVGTLYCTHCPNFLQKSQNDLNHHFAKQHSAPKPDVTFKCKLCYQEFPGFYALHQHRNTQHGMQIGSRTRDVDVEHIVGYVDDHSLREEMRSCQHFLVDSELERARHKVFNYRVETLNETVVNEKLDHFFNNLKCAAKVNLAFGFILKNIEDGGFRYFYAHENSTLLDRSKLVCTHDDLAKLKDFPIKTDVIESCSRERMNTKWRFHKLTNLTVFAALLKDVPMGCKNPVLPEPLLRNGTINCLTSEENTRQPYNDNLSLFRALVLHMHGNQRLEEETSKLFNLFIIKMDGLGPNQFQGVHMNVIPFVEDLLTLNIVLYDIDIVDGNIIGELARRSVQKYENTVRLLRYNNHICYVNNINAVFQSFRFPNCDTFFNRTYNLERHLTTCCERVKIVFPRNVYQIRETLFDKLDSFGINYTSEQKLFKNLAKFDFESIWVQEETFRDTITTTWIGKHVPISVSISSNFVEEPIFLCNSDPHPLVASFIRVLEILASQNKSKMKNLFLDIETTIKIKLGSILEKLTQRHNRREQANLDDCDNETRASTQFLQIQKNQLIDLQKSLERYCNVLPVFGLHSAKYDLNLIKSYLLPILINERDIKPTVIKKANQFISFKFGDIQLLDIMNFLGGTTSLDSFLKAYKISQTKGFFPYEWFDHPDKMQNTELPPYDAFYSKLRSCNPLEAEYTDYVNLLKSGLTTEQAVVKLKLSKPPPTGIENYQYLQQIWKQEQMSSFKDFLSWYNKKDVVPTLEAVQKTIAFYHDKDIDMLKLGCILPNLANICSHKSTDAKFYPFTDGDKDLLEKIREDIVGGPSVVFTRKAVVDETFIRKSTNLCKSIVGIDASQLYPYSMCQPMPTGLYTRWDFDSETSRFIFGQNKTRSFENIVMSYFPRTRPECKIESFFTTGRQKKIDCFSVDGFCYPCNTVFETMGCFYHFCPCQELRLSLTEEKIQRGSKKRELDALRRHYIQEKGFKVIEMWECE